ncbi:uncharacterized protein NEMAJ01_1070 [Nematocida major]|uniref:uncharacterized protein n=1 Tax=Nematocida major TaxID=1912982 RepID=UPI002008532B|nr:uncharacterized protein NEMAJ01_1070 [Nematocida major]KAH9386174.1 hypothetical protein NEMAJ01_1070 [Nematocida major]
MFQAPPQQSEGNILFVQKEDFLCKIESAVGKCVLLRYETDAVPYINSRELRVISIEKESCMQKALGKSFLASICVGLCHSLDNEEGYDCIFISSSLQESFTSFFVVFLQTYTKYRTTKIYCQYTEGECPFLNKCI